MKLAGQAIKPREPEILVLPRGTNAEPVVFTATLVSPEKWKEFHAAVPEPKAPQLHVRGGVKSNIEDAGYVQQMEAYAKIKVGFLVTQSLLPSEIEWDTVDMDDFTSCKNWSDDMRAAGFTENEMNTLLNTCLAANALNEKVLREAREDFLRGQEAAE